jgi:hypothetical protein
MHPALKKVTKVAILEEFLVNSLFHYAKIPIVDIKVQLYSEFNKNKIRKKMKYLSSMNNRRFHPPKCRGKVQKIGEETLKELLIKIPYSCCPPVCLDVVNSCWLAPTHARPAHTSP